MVDFPVYGFDMTPHLANKHNSNLNHMNNANDQNPVIMNGLNWSPWKRARKQSTSSDNVYDLYAVCYHHGSDIETGHYTAACRNPYDNQWYLYDDAKVTNLSQQTNDINSVLVNNSAYILFYQKRSGIYISSSSNSSSAASTSSVGSSGDHWVSRMPKFTIPKQYRNVEKPTVKNTEENNIITPNDNNKTNCVNEEAKKNITTVINGTTIDDAVTLRNSQNTLHSSNSSIRKSTENKSTNTTDIRNSSTHLNTDTQPNDFINHKPIYKTSIYINSSGNVDITTSSSPVISTHRVNGLSQEDVKLKLDNDNTTSFIDDPESCYLSENRLSNGTLKWVSRNAF